MLAAACTGGGDGEPEQESARAEEITGPIVAMVVASSIDDQGSPIDPTFTFAPDTPQMTVIVRVGEITGSPLDLTWYQVSEEGESELFTHRVKVETNDLAYSTGENPGTLAAGSYKVTATLEGKSAEIEWDVAGDEVGSVEGSAATAGQPPAPGDSGTVPGPTQAVTGSSGAAGPGVVVSGELFLEYRDLAADNVELTVASGWIDANGDTVDAPEGFPVEVSATVKGPAQVVASYDHPAGAGLYQRAFALDPCGLPGGSDLPGTKVMFKVTSRLSPKVTGSGDSTLGDDTSRPGVRVVSTPARETKVEPGDQITLDVTATEERSGASWQEGVQQIQVLGPDGVVGEPALFNSFRGKSCDAKSWRQTSKVVYTVPNDPPPVIQLCALADDFAGNQGSNCGTFYTGDRWTGTMHLAIDGNVVAKPFYACRHTADYEFTLTVPTDGEVSGSGTADSSPLVCDSNLGPVTVPGEGGPIMITGFLRDGTFSLNMIPSSGAAPGAWPRPAFEFDVPITAIGKAETRIIGTSSLGFRPWRGMLTLTVTMTCETCEQVSA